MHITPLLPFTDWQEQPVTILGLSKSGVATARYLQQMGARCFISDTLPATEKNQALRQELEAMGVEVEMGGHSEKCFAHSPLVILSPGIPPTNSIVQQLSMSGKTLMSEVNLAYEEGVRLKQHCPSLPKLRWAGITGTNGKTTVTTLLSHILTKAGLNAPACGNIGVPIIERVNPEHHPSFEATTPTSTTVAQVPDVLVAELSSFQLHFSSSLTTEVAIFTNFAPDHLDWHGSISSYFHDKTKLFLPPGTLSEPGRRKGPDWVVLPATDPAMAELARQIEQAVQHGTSHTQILWFAVHPERTAQYPHRAFLNTQGRVEVHWQPLDGAPQQVNLVQKDRLKLIGAHNMENVLMASAAAAVMGVQAEVITQVCETFEGVEHRLEPLPAMEGVVFYNDSKATNPEATISAVRAFEGKPFIWIAGGKDKMTPLEPLIQTLSPGVQSVVLFGQARQRFAKALELAGISQVQQVETLDEAVEWAQQSAQDILNKTGTAPAVLFSPACASFDQFANFEERGKHFKSVVSRLSASRKPSETCSV